MTIKSGLLVNVFYATDTRQCATKGPTAIHDHVLLILPDGGPIKVDDATPCMIIKKKPSIGRHSAMPQDYFYAVPVDSQGNEIEYNDRCRMFGGNFIWCSDSRFPNRQPIPVHDRFELYQG